MNFKTTIILAILVLAGVIYLATVERKLPTTEELQKQEKKVFPDFKSEQGDKLEIKREGETVALEKVDKDHWKMTKPLAVRADKGEANSILSEFEWMQKNATVKKEEGKKFDLADYGLDKPRLEAAFWTGSLKEKDKDAKADKKKDEKAKEPKKYALLVGKKTPVGKDVYVKLPDADVVYAVGESIVEKLEKKVAKLRDKTVIEVEKDDVEKVELQPADKKAIECVREKDTWKLTQPIADRGNKDGIEKVIEKLKDLKTDEDGFITEDDSPASLAKHGLDKPQFVATVYQKGAARTVLFGKGVEGKDDKIYAKTKAEPSILAVKKEVISDLTKEPNDLRDKKVVRFSTDDVKEVAIKKPDLELAMAKKDSDWNITKPAELKADSTEVSDFLKKVEELEVREWVVEKADDLKKYGLDKPAAELTLTLKDDKGAQTLLVGSKLKEGDKCYLKRGDQDVILTASTGEFYDKALAGPLAFRNRQVLEFSKSNVKKLTVEREGKTFACQPAKEGSDEKWELTKPLAVAANTSAVDDILWDLSYLKAKKFAAEAPKNLDEFGLAKPKIKAVVEYEEEVKEEKKEEPKDDKDKKADDKKKDEKKDAKKDEKKEEKKPEKRMVSKTLAVGTKGDGDNPYAKLDDSNLVFVLDSSVVKHLEKELASLNILKFAKADAKTIALKYQDKEVKFEKKGEDWEMTAPEAKKGVKSDVDDILDTLYEFKADSIETYSTKALAQFGLDKPELKLSVGLDKGERIVLVGKKKGDKDYFLKGEPSQFIFVVSDSKVEKLMKEKTQPKEEPKPEAKPEEKKPEAKAETKPAAKAPAKAEAKPAAKAKTDAKAPEKPAAKAPAKAAPATEQPKPAPPPAPPAEKK